MAVTLHIPDSITNRLRLPESEIDPRLRLDGPEELAEDVKYGTSV
jgi:hypothetical protein